MKKYISMLSLLVFTSALKAQLNLTFNSNAPVVGDSRILQSMDSTAAIPKMTGTGNNWNFSNFTTGTFSESISYTTASSTPSGSLFPSSNLALARAGSNYEYYNSQSNMLSVIGMADPTMTSVATFSNAINWINWPKSLGNSITDNFSGVEISPSYTNNWSGTVTVNASGTGTVVLPNGNTHNNCLQVRRTMTLNISGTSSYSLWGNVYEYYSGSYKFPIFSVEYQTVQTGTFSALTCNTFVDKAAQSVGLNELTKGREPNIFPNPCNDRVYIDRKEYVEENSVELFDVDGKLVMEVENVDAIDVSKLANGFYTLRISDRNKSTSKKILIQH